MSAITLFGIIRNGIKSRNIYLYKKITQRLPVPGVLSASYSTIHPASKANFLPTNLPLYETSRQKGTSKIRKFKSKDEPKSESQSEEEELEEDTGTGSDKNSRLIKVNVATLRADAIIKNSLGIARNKIDTLFYDNKIRLNGEKLSKKNTTVKEGDEIDIIKGFSQDNPEFLVVARVEILETIALDNAIGVKARRYKTLTIENYEKDKYEQ